MTLRFKFWHCACSLFISWRHRGAEIASRFRKWLATVPSAIPKLVNVLCVHKPHHRDWFLHRTWPQQCSLLSCCHFKHFLLAQCLVDVLKKLENQVQREKGDTLHWRTRQTCGTKKPMDLIIQLGHLPKGGKPSLGGPERVLEIPFQGLNSLQCQFFAFHNAQEIILGWILCASGLAEGYPGCECWVVDAVEQDSHILYIFLYMLLHLKSFSIWDLLEELKSCHVLRRLFSLPHMVIKR